jgi:hypothetical protein
MKKQKHRFKDSDWEKYEEDTDELYSYLKKKGKHKRAKTKHSIK